MAQRQIIQLELGKWSYWLENIMKKTIFLVIPPQTALRTMIFYKLKMIYRIKIMSKTKSTLNIKKLFLQLCFNLLDPRLLACCCWLLRCVRVRRVGWGQGFSIAGTAGGGTRGTGTTMIITGQVKMSMDNLRRGLGEIVLGIVMKCVSTGRNTIENRGNIIWAGQRHNFAF